MFDNILRFACLFLSGDISLMKSHPEYFIEKFNYFIGKKFEIKKIERDCKMYTENVEQWGIEDYRINSILLFLLDVNRRSSEIESNGLLKSLRCEPDDLLIVFNKWIGDHKDVEKGKKGGLNVKLEEYLLKYYLVYEDKMKKVKLNEKLKKIKL